MRHQRSRPRPERARGSKPIISSPPHASQARRARASRVPAVRRRIAPIAGGILLSCLLTVPAPAQEPLERQGLWLGLGLGAGFDRISCQICDGSVKAGVSGYARLGGTVSENLLLGGELTGWRRSETGVSESLGAVGLVVLWYPDASAGLYVKGGAGVLGLRVADGEDAVTSTTFAPAFGVGYELRVGQAFSIAPFANLIVAPSGTLRLNGDEVTGGATFGLIQGGVGVTWH